MISTKKLSEVYQIMDNLVAESENCMSQTQNIMQLHNENGLREGIMIAKILLEDATNN